MPHLTFVLPNIHTHISMALTLSQLHHVNAVKTRGKVCFLWGIVLIVLQLMRSYHIIRICQIVNYCSGHRGISSLVTGNLMMYSFGAIFAIYGIVVLNRDCVVKKYLRYFKMFRQNYDAYAGLK